MTSPPLYYDGLLIGGMSGGDWGGRGFLFALDAKTGDERWRFYVAPGPGEIGNNTWFGNEWMRGGGAIWLASSVDPALDMVYFVTGNPIPWNGRGPGQNLFTDSMVALDIHTGDYRWHFQAIHHDIWDYDLPNPPYPLRREVRGPAEGDRAPARRPAGSTSSTARRDQPLIGIEESKVPQDKFSNTWPTRSRTRSGIRSSASARRASSGPTRLRTASSTRSAASTRPTTPIGSSRARPSASGGVDWPPTSYNPDTNLAYVCATDGPGLDLGAIPKRLQRFVPGDLSSRQSASTSAAAARRRTGATSPRWTCGRTSSPGAVRWPTHRATAARVTTAGGLVFVGTTEGLYLAYDALRGELLWRSPKVVDAIINAPGTTYQAGGKQYVVIATRGIEQHDKINAYALP